MHLSRASSSWRRPAAAISLGALVAYFLSRSVGLPSMSDDIGDWANPLGLAAVACEALTLICWIASSGEGVPAPRHSGRGVRARPRTR
jgi:hypothetical protein